MDTWRNRRQPKQAPNEHEEEGKAVPVPQRASECSLPQGLIQQEEYMGFSVSFTHMLTLLPSFVI